MSFVRAPRRAVRRALAALAACLATPAVRAGASPVEQGQPATGWPARVHPATRAALDALADSARAAGVPLQPLYDKAAEGVLKRATEERIVAAVRLLARDLATARGALGAEAAPGELVAAAAAVRAGVPREALRDLAATRPRRGGATGAGLAVPLSLLVDLIGRGVPSGEAVRSVGALVARGLPDAELSALWDGIRADIAAGMAPQAAALTRTRAVVEGLDARGGPVSRPTPRIVPPAAPPEP